MQRNCPDCQRKVRWCKDMEKPPRCYDCNDRYRKSGGKKRKVVKP